MISNININEENTSESNVSDMNVDAIRCYQQGDGRSASHILIRAIRILHQQENLLNINNICCPNNRNAATTGERHHQSPTCCMSSGSNSNDNSPMIHDTTTVSTSPESTMRCQGFSSTAYNNSEVHLYRKPFLIEMSRTTAVGCCGSREARAALLFNLALVHHEAGIQRGKSALLKKALLIYEQALRQLQHPTSVLVLVAAICNNRLNLLITYFYDIAEAKKQSKFIDRTLRQIEKRYILRRTTNANDSLYDPTSPSQSISLQDLHYFRLSIAFVKIHGFRFSPAA
jgi:hypothetical protein